MFYSEEILTSKGPLAKVWLAAHMEKKLSKAQLLSTELEPSIVAIANSEVPNSLRLNGQLLLGIVRIYSRKAKYLLEDCSDINIKLKMAFRPGIIDLPADQLYAQLGAITLQDAISEFAILIPDPEFDLKNWEIESRNVNQLFSRQQDITMHDSLFQQSPSMLRQGAYDVFSVPDAEPDFGFGIGDPMGFGDLAPPSSGSVIEAIREGTAANNSISPMSNILPNFNNTISPKDSLHGTPISQQLLAAGIDITALEIPSLSGLPQAEFLKSLQSLNMDGIDLTVPFLPKNAAQVRKRKNLIDNITEIPSHEYHRNIKDTSDIITDDLESPHTKKQLVSWDLEKDLMNLNGPSELIPELQSMFSRIDLNSVVPEISKDPVESHFDDFNPIGDSGIPFGSELGFGSIESDFQDGGINESILFKADNATYQTGIFDSFEPELPESKLSEFAVKAINLIKDNIEERSQQLNQPKSDVVASFDEIIAKEDVSKRSAAVKLFFETLVLKTKDFIDVEQKKPYNQIGIIGKAGLFS